jgi:hypothetical protein
MVGCGDEYRANREMQRHAHRASREIKKDSDKVKHKFNRNRIQLLEGDVPGLQMGPIKKADI